MASKLKCGVLTISDSCSSGAAADRSGPVLVELIQKGDFLKDAEVTETAIVPDDVQKIQSTLVGWSTISKLDLVLTTGGTGLSSRDVTPEAVKGIIDRDIFGMSFAMISGSLEITPMAMIARPVCGVKERTIIITLPGSPKAAKECLTILAPALPHALDLVRGDKQERVVTVHEEMQKIPANDQHDHHRHQHSCPGHSTHYPERAEPSDPSKVARRHRESPYPMVAVEEALKLILDATPSPRTLGTERIDVLNSVGRVLADSVHASCDIPPFDASIMDGYAVLSSDGAGERKLIRASTAGDQPHEMSEVTPGFCVRISTGAPLPPGADAVVKLEDTELVEEVDDGREEVKIRILSAPAPRTDIRPKGCDVKAGCLVLSSGATVCPADVGLMASVGITSVCVYRQPRISILSSGNEVIDAWSADSLPPGRIWDANSPTLAALLTSKGFVNVKRAGVAPDDETSLVRCLRTVLEDCDVLITTGGVSMGEKDLFKYVLERHFSASISFGRVNMKPGKPTTFAALPDGKLVFALPGNPASTFVTANLFALPCLRKYTGKQPYPLYAQVELGFVALLDPRPEYHRVFLKTGPTPGKLPVALSTGSQMSSRLLSASSADALLLLPASQGEMTSLKEGAQVTAMLL